MGYRRMNINDLKDIRRRLIAGQSISGISNNSGFDRKTIRAYRDSMESAGALSDDVDLNELDNILFKLLPANEKNSPVQDGFSRHLDEIKDLINREKEPLKMKTAFMVIKQKYDIEGSYESFKVYARKQNLSIVNMRQYPRLELEPGKETQIDYCQCGLFEDTETGKNRVVYGFIGKLSSSRMPYVEFTYSQNQQSFVESNIRMIEFFGGVTEYFTIDNLKAGVIKADIYDPQLNRAYAEFAEHYNTFINPCIPRHPKGKPKVERQVQEVRELFRRLKEVHPSFTLKELNGEALKWCRDEYGMTKHGTTGRRPTEVFKTEERPLLKPLNPVRFEIPIWKPAKVHNDQFISFEKKRFSLPLQYRKQTVYCRRTGVLLKIYDNNNLFIRQYVITSKKLYTLEGDFPPDYEAMMKGTYPQYLIKEAAKYGSGTKQLIESVLRPHAFINARCAKGMLELIGKYEELPFLQQICKNAAEMSIRNPKRLKTMLEDEHNQKLFDFVVPRSPEGQAMIRDIREYIN